MWDYFTVIYDTHLREIKRIVGDHLNIRIYQYVFLGLKPAQCDLVLTQSTPSKSRPKFVFEF